MPPVQYTYTDIPTRTNWSPHMDITTSTNEYTKEQKCRLSNGIDQNIWSYADALQGANNIGDTQGKNNIRDVFITDNFSDARSVNNTRGMFGDTCVLMEIN